MKLTARIWAVDPRGNPLKRLEEGVVEVDGGEDGVVVRGDRESEGG